MAVDCQAEQLGVMVEKHHECKPGDLGDALTIASLCQQLEAAQNNLAQHECGNANNIFAGTHTIDGVEVRTRVSVTHEWDVGDGVEADIFHWGNERCIKCLPIKVNVTDSLRVISK